MQMQDIISEIDSTAINKSNNLYSFDYEYKCLPNWCYCEIINFQQNWIKIASAPQVIDGGITKQQCKNYA